MEAMNIQQGVVFFGSFEQIITNVFKGKLDYFDVFITIGKMKKNIRVKSGDIKFYVQKNEIIIELPAIDV